MADKYAIPNIYTDYRGLIDDKDLQAVVVAVPDDLHYSATMDALDAGLHVLCEKPLALNAEHARIMYEKAEEAGVKHMTYFTWRWLPSHRYVRLLIDEGYIGAPYHSHFRFLGGWGREARYGWRFDRGRSNGVLGDLGSHMIDLARFWIGDIVRVNARLDTFVKRPGPDGGYLDPANDSAMLILEFESGAVGLIDVSIVAHTADRPFEQYAILHGDLGTLEVGFDLSRGHTVRGAHHDEEAFRSLATVDEMLTGVDVNASEWDQLVQVFTTQSVGTRLFVDAIVQDQPVSPTFYDGLKAQEVIDAAIASNEQGCWVALR